MKNKLPKTLKIGWRDYRIIEWDQVEAQAARHYGECSSTARSIKIDTFHGGRQTANTLLHETMHALIDTVQPPKFLIDNNEEAVSYFSDVLAVLARDNPGLFTLLDRLLSGKES